MELQAAKSACADRQKSIRRVAELDTQIPYAVWAAECKRTLIVCVIDMLVDHSDQ